MEARRAGSCLGPAIYGTYVIVDAGNTVYR